nr:hypothetical protein BaRGS_019492 [Batillaria attramentaria]
MDVIKVLDAIQPRAPKTARKDWYHPELDRQGAVDLLEINGLLSGLFLIRPSKRQEGWHALTLCYQRTHYHYEIKNAHYRDHFVHFIDDGPYLLSLEELVQHYSLRADGLPCALRFSVNTSHALVELPSSADEYCNLPNLPFATDDEYRPDLPPRPPSITEELSPRSPGTPHPPTPGTNTSRPPLPSNPPPASRSGARTPEPDTGDNSTETLYKINPKHIKKGTEIGQGEYGSVLKGTLTEYKGKKQKVEEYLPKGSMLDFLLDYPDQVQVKPDLYLWAAQIAYGMVYLEKKQLVHRDLAARNILIKDKKQVKISDFGLSRATGAGSDYYKASHGGRWPIKWYAPESVNYGHFSHASDVWSFGITLWEMFSFGQSPYGEKKGIEVVQFIEKGKRLSKPEKCPEIVYQTMLSCWKVEPEKRPTFRELNKHFQEEETYADVRELWQRRREH